MSAFPFAAELSAGPAIQVIRNCARDHGLRAAVVVLMQLSGIEPTAEAVGSHIGALAGLYLNRVCGETVDPLDFITVKRLVKFQCEEKLGDVLRTNEEVLDAVGGFAFLELLDGLKRAERSLLS